MNEDEVDRLGNLLNTTLFSLQSLVRRFKRDSEQRVYRNDKEAAEKTGIGIEYWKRIKHEMPYVKVPPKSGSREIRIYPIKAVDKWIEEHTIYPD